MDIKKNLQIGDVIASIRRKKRLDQKQMADELGISSSYLSQVENNTRNPSGKLLRQIADKLNIPVSVLLFEALEDSSFANEEDRQLFIKSKHLMDKMLDILLLSEEKIQNK